MVVLEQKWSYPLKAIFARLPMNDENLLSYTKCLHLLLHNFATMKFPLNIMEFRIGMRPFQKLAGLPREKAIYTYLLREWFSVIAYSKAKISRQRLRNSFLFQKNVKRIYKKQIRQTLLFRQLIKERTTMSIWILPGYFSRGLRWV